jgi:hypothetical protein
MAKIWKVLDSRAVFPVEVVEVTPERYYNEDSNAVGMNKNGREVYGFDSIDGAVARARQLIDRSEAQAKAQLLNCQKHRIRLEQSIKEYGS